MAGRRAAGHRRAGARSRSRSRSDESWHPVPSDLGSHKERATAFHVAWQMHVGPGELLFAGREAAAGRDESASAAAAGAEYVTSRRTLWH